MGKRNGFQFLRVILSLHSVLLANICEIERCYSKFSHTSEYCITRRIFLVNVVSPVFYLLLFVIVLIIPRS